MRLSRRDFLKASAALAGAIAAAGAGPAAIQQAASQEAAQGRLPIIWLNGLGCSGCSVSLLNSVNLDTIDHLLLKRLDLQYHPTLMAAAGEPAVAAAEAARKKKGYVLVVEGAIPTAEGGRYCWLWPGMTMLAGVQSFAADAQYILAVGTCAAYGGVSGAGGRQNPTGSKGVRDLGLGKPLINVPGCPAHPDWIVGTIAALMAGRPPELDDQGRPKPYFATRVHDACPNLDRFNQTYGRRVSKNHNKGKSCLSCHSARDSHVFTPRTVGSAGCLYALGCKGRYTFADCPTRRWNGAAAGAPGVNWCVGAQSPCMGCTQPEFPDGMSPFMTLGGMGVRD